jgi:hypothetical protein
MTHRAQLTILALLIVLLLVFALFPRSAASDAPLVASAVPQSEFVAIGTAGPLASGQAPSIPAVLQLRTQEAIDGMPEVRVDPVAAATVAPRPSADPLPTPVLGMRVGRQVAGVASWFRSPRGVSAAGPALRTALGPGWRGTRVRVTGPAGSAWTTLGDWMAADRLIDLDDDVFVRVCGPLSKGICEAKVTW